MKKHILLLTMTVLTFSASAQNWALPSSKWTINYAWLSPVYYYTLKVEGDTVVDGVSCKKIGAFNPLYTYESNDTVYIRLNGKFRPTYYFNASVGDTISFYDANQCGGDSIVHAVVDEIDSIDVGNKFLKRFKSIITDRDSTSIYGDLTYTYIENVGSNYLYPYLYCTNIFDQESIGICDYGDSTIQNFYVFHNNCVSVSIDEVNFTDKEISVFPNPFSDELSVQYSDDKFISALSVFDLTGRTLKNISRTSNKIDLQDLPNGNYILDVHLMDGQTIHKRIIKL